MEILKGFGFSLLIITIIKLIDYRLKKRKGLIHGSFDPVYFFKDNWMDYCINIGLSFIVYSFDHDVIVWVNEFLDKMEFKWQLIHVENKLFFFVLVPVVIAGISYKFFRNKLAIPTQQKVSPHITKS
ncbi:hypothetical protein ACE939_00825 [Aquimarina sp. W85]|uniref:hypothetical protein n=1 Tax=Aquimarina rhodophyticola TaxID=3342246 RepID=UPI0036704DA2